VRAGHAGGFPPCILPVIPWLVPVTTLHSWNGYSTFILRTFTLYNYLACTVILLYYLTPGPRPSCYCYVAVVPLLGGGLRTNGCLVVPHYWCIADLILHSVRFTCSAIVTFLPCWTLYACCRYPRTALTICRFSPLLRFSTFTHDLMLVLGATVIEPCWRSYRRWTVWRLPCIVIWLLLYLV